MNKVFRVMWNASTQSWVAVSELARGRVKFSTNQPVSNMAWLMLGVGVLTTEDVESAKAIAGNIDNVYVETNAAGGNKGHENNILIGQSATAFIGGKNGGEIDNNVVIGNSAEAQGSKGIAIGFNAKTDTTNAVGFTDQIAIGTNTKAHGFRTIAIGLNASTTSLDGIALGVDAKTTGQRATAIGHQAAAVLEAVAVGSGAKASKNRSVALGYGSTTDTEATKEGSIEVNQVVYDPATGEVSNANMQVSFGKAGSERQLKHIAPGKISADSTDAINGSQLYSITKGLQSRPITFQADSQSTARTLGETLQIKGGNGSGTFSTKNVKTVASTGKIEIQFSDNPTFVTLTTTGNAQVGGTLTATGQIIANGGLSVAGNQNVNMGNNRIQGVQAGTQGTDAVNLTQLNSVRENTLKLESNNGETSTQRLDKSGGLSFGVKGDGTYISSSASGSAVTFDLTQNTKNKINNAADKSLSNLDSAGLNKIKEQARGTVAMTDGINTKATTTESGGVKTFKVDVDLSDYVRTADLANAAKLSYKANQEQAKQVALTTGISFQNTGNLTLSTGENGVVNVGLDQITQNEIKKQTAVEGHNGVLVSEKTTPNASGGKTFTVSLDNDHIKQQAKDAVDVTGSDDIQVNPTDTANKKSFAVSLNKAHSVTQHDQKAVTSKAVYDAIRNSGWTVKVNNDQMHKHINNNASLMFKEGKNISLALEPASSSITIRTVDTPTFTNLTTNQEATIGGVLNANGGVRVAGSTSVDMGNNRVQNVQAGVQSTDAVNVAQLDTVRANTLKIEGNSGTAGTQRFDQQNGLSFVVKGEGTYISSSASGSTVTFDLTADTKNKIDSAANKALANLEPAGVEKIKEHARDAVQMIDGTNTKVTTTTTDSAKTFQVDVDLTKATLAYKADGEQGNTTPLATGLTFKNTSNLTIRTEADGVVNLGLDQATQDQIKKQATVVSKTNDLTVEQSQNTSGGQQFALTLNKATEVAENNNNVVTSSAVHHAITNSGWIVQVNDAQTNKHINNNATLMFKEGKNINLALDSSSSKITIQTIENPTFASLTTTGTANLAGLTVTGNNAVNMGNNVVQGVAEGNVDTDAVNVKQLNEVRKNQFKLLADSTQTSGQALDKSGGLSFGIKGQNYIETAASGDDITIRLSDVAKNIIDSAANQDLSNLSDAGRAKIKEQIGISNGNNTIATIVDADGVKTFKVDVDLDKTVFSYKAEGENEEKNTSLSNGLTFKNTSNLTISTEGNGVVNIGLDEKTKSEIAKQTTVTSANDDISVSDKPNTSGGKEFTLSLNKSNAVSKDDEKVVTSKAVHQAIENSGWFVKVNNDADGKHISNNGTVTFQQDKNIEVNFDAQASKITIKTVENPTFTSLNTSQGATIGGMLNARGGLTVADSQTVHLGNNIVQGVKSGVNLTDAANIGQLNEVRNNHLKLAGDTGNTHTQLLNTTGGLSFGIKGQTDYIETKADGSDVSISLSESAKTKIDTAADQSLSNLNELGKSVLNQAAKNAVNVTGNTDITVSASEVDTVKTFALSLEKSSNVAEADEKAVTSKAVYEAIRDSGWLVKVNDGQTQHINNNGTVAFQESDNINIRIDDQNKITIKTVESPTFSSLTTSQGATIGGMLNANGGLMVGAGTSISMGNNVVSGVADGVAQTDAANMKQLNEVRNNHFKLTGDNNSETHQQQLNATTGLSFGVKGQVGYIETKAEGSDVTISLSEAAKTKIDDAADQSLSNLNADGISKIKQQIGIENGNNTIATATEIGGVKTFKVDVDLAKTEFAYKAGDEEAKNTTLSKGLTFKSTANLTINTDADGVVIFGLDDSTNAEIAKQATVTSTNADDIAIAESINASGGKQFALSLNKSSEVSANDEKAVTSKAVHQAIANSGWLVKVNEDEARHINNNGTVAFRQDRNIEVSLDEQTNKITIKTIESPTFTHLTTTDSATFGGMLNAHGGLTVASGKSVDMGNNVISGVAEGKKDTDAANMKQLNELQNNLTTKGLHFKGTEGNTARKLGETLTIMGNATTQSDYSSANVKTVVSDGKIEVQFADNPSFKAATMDQLTVNNTATVGGMLTANGGITVAERQTVNMGNNVVTGVADGIAVSDAATIGQLNKVRHNQFKLTDDQGAATDNQQLDQENGLSFGIKGQAGYIETKANGSDVAISLNDETKNKIDTAANQSLSNLNDDGRAVLNQAAKGAIEVKAEGLASVEKSESEGKDVYTVTVSDEKIKGSAKEAVDVIGNEDIAIASSSTETKTTFAVSLNKATTVAEDDDKAVTSKAVYEAIQDSGWFVKVNDEMDGKHINNNASVTFKQGENIEISRDQQTNIITVRTVDNPTFTTLTTKGAATIGGMLNAHGGLTVAADQTVDMGGNVLQGVKNGANATDAANMAQLNELRENLTTTGLHFAGSEGKTLRHLGETLTIMGNATTQGDYSSDNVKTVVTEDGKVEVQFAENPLFNTVVAEQLSVNTNAAIGGMLSANGGFRVAEKQTVHMGNNRLEGVAEAIADSDATNFKQVKSLLAESAWRLDTGAVDGGIDDTDSNLAEEWIHPNDQLKLQAGKNLKIKREANGSVTYSTQDEVSFERLNVSGQTHLNQLTVNGVARFNQGFSVAPAQTVDMGGNRLQNVGDAKEAGDAVNLKQLQALSDALTKAGISFNGNEGETLRQLGELLSIKGDATTSGNYHSGNIKTVVADGEVKIQFAENPTFANIQADSLSATHVAVSDEFVVNGDTTLGGEGRTLRVAENTHIDMGGNVIRNIGSGSIAAGSQDAVNGGDVHTAIHEASQHLTNTGLVFSGNNTETKVNRKLGEELRIVGGGMQADDQYSSHNVKTLGSQGGEIEIKIAKNPTFEDITANRLDSQSAHIERATFGDVTLGGKDKSFTVAENTRLDMGGNVISNIGSGKISAESQDAVNGSDVHRAISEATTSLTEGGLKFVGNNGETITTRLGGSLNIVGNGDISSPDFSADNIRTVTQGDKLVIEMSTNPAFENVNAKQINAGKTTLTEQGLVLGDANGTKFTQNGIHAGNQVIGGVANGDISATSNQAVNGAQLYAIQQLVGNGKQETKVEVINNEGSVTTIAVPVSNNYTLTTYNVENQKEYRTNNVIEAIGRMNEQGIKFFHTNDGEVKPAVQGENTVDSSASGRFATAVGYQAIAQGENAIAFGKGAKAEGENTISLGHGNIVTGNNSGAIGDPSTVSGNHSYSVGNDNHIKTDNTFVFGNNVSNTTDNSVFLGANTGYVAQGKTTQGTAAYTSQKIGSDNYQYAGGKAEEVVGVVSIGNVGADGAMQTRRIQQVAPGLVSQESTDAINGSQLYALSAFVNQGWQLETGVVAGSNGVAENAEPVKVGQGNAVRFNASHNIVLTQTGNIIDIAVAKTPVFESLQINKGGNVDMGGNRIQNVGMAVKPTDALNYGQFKSELGKVDSRLRSGIAGAVASASLVQAFNPSESIVAIGGGTYRGASAVSVGYSKVSDNGKVIVKLTGSANNYGDISGGASIGFKF